MYYVYVCILFTSKDTGFQTFQVCKQFTSWTGPQDWTTWALGRFLDIENRPYESDRLRRGKPIGPISNYDITVSSITRE